MNRKSRVFAVVLVAVFALAGRQTAAQQGGPSLEKCESLSVDVAEAKEWIIDEDRMIDTLRTRPGPALEAQGREGDSQGRSEEVREARVSFAEGSCNDERVERFLKEIRENTENLHDQDCNRLRALVELVERVDAQVVDGVATLDWDSYDLEIPEHVSLPDELDMELASDVLENGLRFLASARNHESPCEVVRLRCSCGSLWLGTRSSRAARNDCDDKCIAGVVDISGHRVNCVDGA